MMNTNDLLLIIIIIISLVYALRVQCAVYEYFANWYGSGDDGGQSSARPSENRVEFIYLFVIGE